jgi:hypothetical protein
MLNTTIMKTKLYITALMLFCAAVITGCGDLDSEGVSKTTYYAIIQLNGEQWNRVSQGDTWTDPGAVATEDEQEIALTTGGDVVDTNTPGVYTITYKATNKDGFSSTAYRYVGVIAPSVEGIDLTGKYKRNAGAFGVSTVTKVADNLYKTDNVGGVAAGGPGTTVYFYHYDDGTLGVPYQIVAGSPFYCTDASVDVGASYSWVVINGGYGTALRTFIKQ